MATEISQMMFTNHGTLSSIVTLSLCGFDPLKFTLLPPTLTDYMLNLLEFNWPQMRGKIWCHVKSSVIKTFLAKIIKLLRCETKVYTPRKRDGERFYTVNFYLGKWFWGTQYRFAGSAYLLIVVYGIFGFSCWQRGTTSELLALIYTKLKGRCTFVGRVVSLLSGAEKKTWRISHFCDWQPSWLLAFTIPCPLRASGPNPTNY